MLIVVALTAAAVIGPVAVDQQGPAAKLLAWRCDMERVRSAVVPLSAVLRSRTWDAMAEQIAACAREQA